MSPIDRRKFISTTGVALGVTALAGCGGDGGDGGDGGSDGGSDGGDGGSDGGDSGSDGGSDGGDGGDGSDGGSMSLEERAREEGTATLYSVIDAEGMRNTILPPFKERYDWLDLEVVAMGVSEIASTMSTESQTGNAKSDAAINTKGTMTPLVGEGVFREPDPEGELMQFVKENYSDDLYTLPAVPGYLFPIQVMYHTERVSDDEVPESFEDFAGSALEGRIAFDDPTILNTSGGQFATLREIWGADKWRSTLQDIANNSPTLTDSSSESARLLAQGEADVVIGSLNDTLSLQDDGEPVEGLWLDPQVALNLPIYFSEGSNNPNAAEFFAKWFLGEEGQRALAKTGRVPVDSDIAAEEFEDVIPSDVQIKPVAFNDQSYYNDPDTWISRYEDIFG
jgi:ABC-type Fe3+ transport system substrate-binding protein